MTSKSSPPVEFPCSMLREQLHISSFFPHSPVVVVAVVMLYSTQFTGSTVSTSITVGCRSLESRLACGRGLMSAFCLLLHPVSSRCGHVSFHFDKHFVCLLQKYNTKLILNQQKKGIMVWISQICS